MRNTATRFVCARWSSVLASMLVGLGFAQSAHSLYKEVSFRELVNSADLIVIATVAESQSRWGEGGKMIFTDVSLVDVDPVFDNKAYRSFRNNRLTVTLAGGELDGQGIVTADAPEFNVGDRVMLYLNHYDHPVITPLVGGMQGAFRLIRDEKTAKEVPLTWGGNGIRSIDQNGRLRVTAPVARVSHGAPDFRGATSNRQNPNLPIPGPGSQANAQAKFSETHDARDSAPVQLMTVDDLLAEVNAVLKQAGRNPGTRRND